MPSPETIAVLEGRSNWSAELADVLNFLRSLPSGSVDMVLGSPPYAAKAKRYHGLETPNLSGEEWVAWMVEVFKESMRVCKGLVAFVVDASTKKFRWAATPILLAADLHRAGIHLRKPLAYVRNGVSGSGGPDWFRNNWEFVLCASHPGKLPWSDVLACGQPPKYKRSGPFTNRRANGTRSHRAYKPPAIANPGNVIQCVVGGGRMGSHLSHDNEAPFPEKLVERMVLSFCPPGGITCDPFVGGGTTPAVCLQHGRRFVGCDNRVSQIDLTTRRVAEVETGVYFKPLRQPHAPASSPAVEAGGEVIADSAVNTAEGSPQTPPVTPGDSIPAAPPVDNSPSKRRRSQKSKSLKNSQNNSHISVEPADVFSFEDFTRPEEAGWPGAAGLPEDAYFPEP